MRAMNARNYYELLCVSRDAPAEVIRAAYRTLMAVLRKHPDFGGEPEEAKLINEAYETLSDPARRGSYDASFGSEAQAPIPQPTTPAEDRRRAPRCQSDATISYCLARDERWYPARLRDVSLFGLRMVAREPLRKDQEIVLVLSNPVAPAIRGAIRWSRMMHPTIFERIYEAGVEFEAEMPDIFRYVVV